MKRHEIIFLLLILAFLFAQNFLIPTLNANSESITKINAANLSENLTIYVVPAITNDKILSFSSISTSCISKTISITACPGEFEPASFVIQPNINIVCV